jgi:hypothetical protein
MVREDRGRHGHDLEALHLQGQHGGGIADMAVNDLALQG